MAEKDLQSKVLAYLNSIPRCIAENVSGNADQAGRADINACYKGRSIKIELKDGDTKYKATLRQTLYLKKWEKAGAMVKVCRTLEDVKNVILQIDEEVAINEISRAFYHG